MNILYVLPSLSKCNGVSTYAINYFKNINKEKIKIDFLIINNKIDEEYKSYIEKANSKLYLIEKPKIKTFFGDISKIENFFKNTNYDIIHCHVGYISAIYLKIAKKYNIKIRIWHSHNSNNSEKNKIKLLKNQILKKIALENANYYCACSMLAGKYLFDEREFTLINNAIETDYYKFNNVIRNEIRTNEGWHEKDFIIGHVGRFVPQKNHKFLIEIFDKVYQKDKKAKLVLIGDGPLKDEIEELVKKKNLEQSVIFKGTINNVNEYLQAIDVFILPSLYEGLPIVGIEAQAAGLPCIFSNEITREAQITENCKFIKLNDPIDIWIKSLIELKHNSRSNTQLDIIKNGYDIKNEAKKLEDFYERLMKERI